MIPTGFQTEEPKHLMPILQKVTPRDEKNLEFFSGDGQKYKIGCNSTQEFPNHRRGLQLLQHF